jgi:hypothetical protein
MNAHRTTTHVIQMHHPDIALEVTNDDRSLMVLPLVTAFMEAYGNDNLQQAIGDLIADLGHLYDRLPDDERDDLDGWADFAEFVNNRSLWLYAEEVGEERPPTVAENPPEIPL